MKSLRNHFSVIFPLVVLLMSIQFTLSLEKIVKDYELNLVEDYNIIAVSKTEIKLKDLKTHIEDVKSLNLMSAKKVIEKLKGDISSKNLSLLQVSLPKFYSIKLNYFPTNNELKNIKKTLIKLPNITKVETFSKTHNKIYNIFIIAKYTFYIFTSLILIMSFLLMLKQMRIWVYEHKERMDIMTLFGAPFWMKSAVLYKLAVVDSIISTVIVVCMFFALPYMEFSTLIENQIDILIPQMDFLIEGSLLLVISLVSALVSVSIVMLRIRKG